MSQLITLSKLASLVNEYTGIEITVCEAFIRNMAQTAASGLIEGEHIRIKDFGLFEPRHSVDGTITVEFVPETQFAERVNTPFAHLRPSEVLNKEANTSAAPMQPEMPRTPSYPRQPENPQYVPQQPELNSTPSYPRQPEPPVYMPQQPELNRMPSYPQRPDTQNFPNPTPEFPNAPSTPSNLQEGAPDLPSYLNIPPREQSETESRQEPTTYSFNSGKSHTAGFNRQLPQLSTNKKYILIGVLGIIAGFVLGYLSARYSSESQQNIQEQPKETAEVSEKMASPAAAQEFDYESALSVADIDTLLQEDETTDIPEAPQPAPQVITVKLQKGQRLSDIAQKYYGKKEFWVYIYLENRDIISNPFTVREGAVLRVPPKDKYAPTTDEATNLAWAKSKAAEINGKYIH